MGAEVGDDVTIGDVGTSVVVGGEVGADVVLGTGVVVGMA